MDCQYLYSITEPSKVFQTGKKPVLITCNSTKDYVCKHNFAQGNALFNEFLATSFLKLWGLPVPEYCFLTVRKEHIEEFALQNSLEPAWFQKTCFGTCYLQYAKELDEYVRFIKKPNLSKFNKFDFIKIALFDIWLANDDRNQGNPNLLISAEEGKWQFVPIDHEMIFNGNSERDLYQISDNDSIMAHQLFRLLFKKRNENHQKNVDEVLNNFEELVFICKKNTNILLNSVPKDWEISLSSKKEFLNKNIFSSKWLDETKKNFKNLYNLWIK